MFQAGLLVLALCVSAPVFAASLLPGYGADPEQTSVSGISSGGYMASQFHVAYSTELTGVGIVAGGPYFCAGSDSTAGADLNPFQPYVVTATTTCMNPCKWAFWPFVGWCESIMLPDGEALAARAQAFAADGLIDDFSGLVNDRVYLFSGGLDETVVTGVVNQAKGFYLAAGVPDSAIRFDLHPGAQHAFISDNINRGCDVHGAPFINNCDGYDQAREILQHIYGNLKDNADVLTGTMLAFDQSEFVPESQFSISSLAETAYAYVPNDCETKSCRVHVAFHGCRQSAAEFDTNKVFFRDLSGYNEVADTNQIIVLYPQIRSRDELNVSPYNPKGCWDFWGYTGSGFYKKESIQMTAVSSMIKRLLLPPEPVQ
ncbi:hypothetical protein BGP75_20265 [Motiliproteus sp. MSK22-1]|nr:hypothetical protein BGP75_20265 [Motiliproteus sp. MSK22-1]